MESSNMWQAPALHIAPALGPLSKQTHFPGAVAAVVFAGGQRIFLTPSRPILSHHVKLPHITSHHWSISCLSTLPYNSPTDHSLPLTRPQPRAHQPSHWPKTLAIVPEMAAGVLSKPPLVLAC